MKYYITWFDGETSQEDELDDGTLSLKDNGYYVWYNGVDQWKYNADHVIRMIEEHDRK